MDKENNNYFEVILEGLNVSEESHNKLAKEIRKIVLNELALLDLKGDLIIKNLPKGQELIRKIGPTDGLVAKSS